MTTFPFVLRRIFRAVVSYLLAVAGFLALLNGTFEATAQGEIAAAVNNAMYGVNMKGIDASEVRAIREELRAVLEHSWGLDRPFLARVSPTRPPSSCCRPSR